MLPPPWLDERERNEREMMNEFVNVNRFYKTRLVRVLFVYENTLGI